MTSFLRLSSFITWSAFTRGSYRDCFTTNVPYYFDLCAYEPPRRDDGGGNTDHSNCSGYRANIWGILTSNFTWNHIFLFLIPILILSLGIGLVAIPSMPVQKSGRLDVLSVFSLCLLFSGSLTFLSMLGQPLSWFALLIAIIGGILTNEQKSRLSIDTTNHFF